jgi:hypothetical protein
MTAKVLTILAAIAVAMAVAPVANAAHHAKVVHHSKAGCKGEFMYMKGGKCMDARAKA